MSRAKEKVFGTYLVNGIKELQWPQVAHYWSIFNREFMQPELLFYRPYVLAMRRHGGFLGRVFQKDRNKKTNDGVFLGTLGTFQNVILENILYCAFREMAHSDHFFITFIVN
jgi:hypothetical protein